MEYGEIEERLTKLRDFEEVGRQIYLANPKAFSRTVRGWEEFREWYEQTDDAGARLGEKAPFFMGSQLTEQDSFSEEGMEVAVLLHDRYVPPSYHNLKFIKIVYALKGSFFLYVQEKAQEREIRMREGDFAIIPPEMDQAVCTCEEGAVTVNIIIKRSTFGEAFYSLLLENDSISDFFWQMLYSKGSNRALLVCGGRDERLRQIVLEMCGEGILKREAYSAGKNLMMKGYVMLLCGRAISDHQQEMKSVGSISTREAALPVMIRYIRENYNTVTLPELAGHFGKSEGYLSRYIRRETGRTFRYLQKEFRMKRAAEMIENSSCTMEEVAAAVGYADISCFYRNFKETYGMTPVQYRDIRNRIRL